MKAGYPKTLSAQLVKLCDRTFGFVEHPAGDPIEEKGI